MVEQDSILKTIEETHIESSKLLQQLKEECANLLKDGPTNSEKNGNGKNKNES